MAFPSALFLPAGRRAEALTLRLCAAGPDALERAGFVVHRISGSHYVLRHALDPARRVTVAYHHKDLKPKTLRTIITQAGLTEEQFLDLL